MPTTRTLKLKNPNLPSLNLTAKNLPTVEVKPNKYQDPRLVRPSRVALGKIPAIGRMNT